MTRINATTAEIKIGNIWFPLSRGEVNFSREGIEIESFQGPVSFLPTREIITWRAEIHVTEEFLEGGGTHWFDNFYSLITRSEPVDYEIRLTEGIDYCLHGLIDIDVELDYARNIRILKLTGSSEVPFVRTGGFAGETISFANPAFTDSGFRKAIHEQATELLCMFLEPKQAQEFRKHGRFEYQDKQNRIWKFIRQYHWPIEVWSNGVLQKELCLDIDPQAPTEDLLLWVYLQVKGGRGDEVLETAKGRW